ncbi:MAG: hypothetical protein HY363_06360 [Candidatus Aenigmarchaeota archaeon]|nr:hypothetical protein [Candidatus Aenigmarchaeota archaeon]
MDKNVIIAIVLGALVLVAGIQAFSLMSLTSKVQSGGAVVSAPAQAAGGGSGAALPSNLQNLPSMVGGC